MAHVEVGGAATVGFCPRSLRSCEEMKNRWLVSVGQGPERNRALTLQSSQGAQKSREDRAQQGRASGGGLRRSGSLCCSEQEGTSGGGEGSLGKGAARLV